MSFVVLRNTFVIRNLFWCCYVFRFVFGNQAQSCKANPDGEFKNDGTQEPALNELNFSDDEDIFTQNEVHFFPVNSTKSCNCFWFFASLIND